VRRYQSAQEMDVDLERVARGLSVSRETEETATQIIAGINAMPTQIARAPTVAQTPPAYPAEPVYYDYEEGPRRRPIWPWIVAALLILAALIGGWYVYNQIQDELASREPVAVPLLVGVHVNQATAELDARNLQYKLVHEPNTDQPKNFVFQQDPEEGTKIDPQTGVVTLWVSTGPPMTTVPDVVGTTVDAAVATLKDAKLDPNVVFINSGSPVNQVTAQSIKPDKKVEEGTAIRINVSKGPAPLEVPGVLGVSYEQASATLSAAGFKVARQDVESTQPAGVVVGQDPSEGETAARGSTVTLQVSSGPTTVTVPDVTSQDEESARGQLEDAGFKAKPEQVDTDDPCLDGFVTDQDPAGGTDAEPGSQVTIFVGRYKGDQICG